MTEKQADKLKIGDQVFRNEKKPTYNGDYLAFINSKRRVATITGHTFSYFTITSEQVVGSISCWEPITTLPNRLDLIDE